MRQGDWPITRDLVLAGGGHAHALVLRMWAMDPQPGVRLTLVSPDPAAPYTGMLPGLIAGHYAREDLMIDLHRLAQAAGARFILDRATGLDAAARRLHLAGRPPLAYDVLSLDVGAASGLPEVPGFAEHGVAARPLADLAARWAGFLDHAPRAPQVVIVGAGIGGVELSLAMAHRLRGLGRKPVVTLLEQGPAALPQMGAGARRALLARIGAAGITILTGTRLAAVGAGRVTLHDGRVLPSDFTLAAAGARPHDWLSGTGLVTEGGFVTVGPTLQSSDPAVFAAGDCAHMAHAPRPKAGVFAVRAAPVLFHNLRAALAGLPLRPYHPQRDYLKLVSLGDRVALADKAGLQVTGRWLWRLKDRIDRTFMAKFDDLPAMPLREVPPGAAEGLAAMAAARPLCGGCGAKLGPATLAAAVVALPPPARADVLAGAGDDAAVLRVGGAVQVITTDHLREVTRDTRLMARIAAIHALGDVLAMGAAPQAALAQVTLPAAAPHIQAAMLDELMQAASDVFRAEGADVVGGHSAQGADLVIGFTVTGLLPEGQALRRKGGAQAGDALVLTRGLGSGTVLAALMAQARVPGLILGEAVVATHAAMARLPGPAARRMAPVAHAMTDVTGFGLAGHLLEMLDAAGLGARLSLEAIPVLPGAVALAAAGQASSLAPANRAAVQGRLSVPAPLQGDPRLALLWDPQTCGGFLAAVPADQADRLVADLRAAGDDAARIGDVVAGPVQIDVAD
ncbi:MAG: selenide, water dikinase SelD [Gemmobacter sp.]